MKKLLAMLLICGVAFSAPAGPPRSCEVCQEPLGASFCWLASPARTDRLAVCKACSQLKSVCFVCGVPLKAGFKKLDDGRLLCERDAKAAVFSSDDARAIFNEARRELLAMFSGTGALPDDNLTVTLVDTARLESLKLQKPDRDTTMTLGLTRTLRSRDGKFAHAIFLLDGVGAARLAAVSAHEWTHAWLQENLPAQRRLDDDAAEGFCEWIAYRLMCQRKEETEKKVILANTYSCGQINVLAIAEGEDRFQAVLDWIKSGTEARFEEAMNFAVVARRKPPDAVFTFLQEVQTPVPETLVLKGIGGNARHRFALINNRTLEQNESAAVRVGTSNVVVRCLAIKDAAVVIQIQGQTVPTELLLGCK